MNTKIAKINSILAPNVHARSNVHPQLVSFHFLFHQYFTDQSYVFLKIFFDKLFSQLENFLSNFSSLNHNCRSHTALQATKLFFTLLKTFQIFSQLFCTKLFHFSLLRSFDVETARRVLRKILSAANCWCIMQHLPMHTVERQEQSTV